MDNEKDYFNVIYRQLNEWFVEVKNQQGPTLKKFIAQAKEYAGAAEAMSEEKLQQFMQNLKYDLHEFYILNKADAQSSVYLGLLNETLWDNLAKLTDKSQVEWAELAEDFEHDGTYQTGDFIAFGELKCQACEQKTTITHFSQISNCIHCNHAYFERLPLNP